MYIVYTYANNHWTKRGEWARETDARWYVNHVCVNPRALIVSTKSGLIRHCPKDFFVLRDKTTETVATMFAANALYALSELTRAAGYDLTGEAVSAVCDFHAQYIDDDIRLTRSPFIHNVFTIYRV